QYADAIAVVVSDGQVGLTVAVEVPHRHADRPVAGAVLDGGAERAGAAVQQDADGAAIVAGDGRIGPAGAVERLPRHAERPATGAVLGGAGEGAGPVGVGAVLVDEIDGDAARRRAVGVDVRLVAGAGVGVAGAIAPVDDVLRHGVRAGIADGTQCQRVGCALVDAAGAADVDRRGHVVDGQGEGGHGLHAIVISGGDR